MNKSKKEEFRKYYLSHRIQIINRVKMNQKKNNYCSEKTLKQRKIRYIKRRTRQLYPLEGHFCEVCSNKATERHHNTSPIEIDKFNYLCHKCHILIHQKGGKKHE